MRFVYFGKSIAKVILQFLGEHAPIKKIPEINVHLVLDNLSWEQKLETRQHREGDNGLSCGLLYAARQLTDRLEQETVLSSCQLNGA